MIRKSQIKALFQKWNKALQTRSTQKVVSLYAEDAILLPTLSARVRHNHEEIGEYFDFFLSLSPRATMQEENIRFFGSIAINSGIYVFTVNQNGVEKEIPVRFTFVYQKTDHGWLIVEHHSSALPA